MLIVGIQICLTEAFTFLTCKCFGFIFHSQRHSRLSCSIQEKYYLPFSKEVRRNGIPLYEGFSNIERETAVPSSVTRVTFRISSYSRLRTELLARGEIFALDVSI